MVNTCKGVARNGELPDVGSEPTKRAVSAVHARRGCFHSNARRISPQFNALDDGFEDDIAGAFHVNFSEYLDACAVRWHEAQGGRPRYVRCPCRRIFEAALKLAAAKRKPDLTLL